MSDDQLEERLTQISQRIETIRNGNRVTWWKAAALILAIVTAIVVPALAVTWSGGERAAQLDGVRESVQELKTQIETLRKDTKEQFGAFREDTKDQIGDLRRETRTELRELREDLVGRR